MSGLIRHTPSTPQTRGGGGQVGHPQRKGSGISGNHVDDAAFDRYSPEADGLGVLPPPDLGPEIASGVTDDPRARRQNGTHYRLRTGWRAYKHGIQVITQHQQLTRRSDGRLAPAGDYETADVALYRCAQPPQRRVAEIPQDPRARIGSQSQNIGDGPSHPADHDLSFLPEPARASLLEHIPKPMHYSVDTRKGGAWYSTAGLRMDRQRATVINATIDEGGPTWHVEHYTYTTPDPSPEPTTIDNPKTRPRLLKRTRR